MGDPFGSFLFGRFIKYRVVCPPLGRNQIAAVKIAAAAAPSSRFH
jgi:hypothetical protein